MLNKCANPPCDARFRYLHEGKVFTLDTGQLYVGSTPVPDSRGVERFWLCDACARTFTVVYENGHATTRPLPQPASPPTMSNPPSPRKRETPS